MSLSNESKTESFWQIVAGYVQEMQRSLANIERMRIETDQISAASDLVIKQVLEAVTHRIQIRQQEIAELQAEKEMLQAKLAEMG